MQLKACFKALDSDNSGTIGIEELEEPLIALGLAKSKKEVQDLLILVDLNGNG